MNIQIRRALPADVPALRELIDASVRRLQAQDYTPAQIELALKTVCGVDSQLIADGTYFVAEIESAEKHNSVIAGCGGSEQTQDALRRRPLDRARRLVPRSCPRRRKNSRLLYPSRMGPSRHRRHDPRSM